MKWGELKELMKNVGDDETISVLTSDSDGSEMKLDILDVGYDVEHGHVLRAEVE